MIKVEGQEAIRRAYFIEEKSIRAIARELHHGRRLVRRAIASAEPARYTLKKPRNAPVLVPYKARIDQLLAGNKTLPRKQRYTAHKIYGLIQDDGYTGGESGVRNYIAQRRKALRSAPAYLPLEFDPRPYRLPQPLPLRELLLHSGDRDTKRAGWRTTSASHGTTSWFPFLRWPPSMS